MAGEQGVEFDVVDEDLEIEIDDDGQGEGQGDKAKPAGGDARASAANAEDDDGQDDGQRGAETDDERRERRRDEGRRRRESRRQFAQQDSLIIQELTSKLQSTEKVLQEVQGKQIEMDISAAVAARDRWVRHARSLAHEKARAIDEGRGGDVVALDDKIEEAKRHALWFENKAQTTKREIEEQRTRAQQGPTPEETKLANAKHFLARHPGFDPQLRDETSRRVKQLDIAVERDGFEPHTADYWMELERRIKGAGIDVSRPLDDDEDDAPAVKSHPSDAQPRKSNGQFNSNEPERRGPPVAGKGSAGKATIKVPGSVVAAIKEAGMWDDLPKRNELLREYQKNLEANRK